MQLRKYYVQESMVRNTPEIPETWDENIDKTGKTYYVDTETGEWYRISGKKHKRIDTNEKIDIVTAQSRKEFEELKKQKMNKEDNTQGNGGHKRKDTYSGMKHLFGKEESHDDEDMKLLTSQQKIKLDDFMTMDFVETGRVLAVRYLRESNWDLQMALNAYLQQHHDHLKSRGGSLQFDNKVIEAEKHTLKDDIVPLNDLKNEDEITKHWVMIHISNSGDIEMYDVDTRKELEPPNEDELKSQGRDNDWYRIGQQCEIYSRSEQKWFQASIIHIFRDDEGEWIKCKYGKKTKEIQKDSDHIRSIDTAEMEKKNESVQGTIDKSQLNGSQMQFYRFLKDNRLDKYFGNFEQKECCDVRDIEYLMDDDGFLQNEIGMQNHIQRKRFMGECRKMKREMDLFAASNMIPSMLLKQLGKAGVVTMNILCEEVQDKKDINNKFNIKNENHCDLLWNLVSLQRHDHQCESEGVSEHAAQPNIEQVDHQETAYI
eukprot:209238_1